MACIAGRSRDAGLGISAKYSRGGADRTGRSARQVQFQATAAITRRLGLHPSEVIGWMAQIVPEKTHFSSTDYADFRRLFKRESAEICVICGLKVFLKSLQDEKRDISERSELLIQKTNQQVRPYKRFQLH